MKTWQRVQLGSVLAAIDFDLEGLFGLDYVVLQYRCTSTVGRVNEIQTAENLKSNSASAKLFFIERRRVEREARTGGVKMKKTPPQPESGRRSHLGRLRSISDISDSDSDS
jgi:hypothetical protein